MEAYEGISLAYMSRTTLAHDVGFMAHGELYDARMLILTDMIIGRVYHILKKPDLSEEALAVEVIDEVSRSGDLYLAHLHTVSRFRDSLWLPPKYINRKHFSLDHVQDINELLTVEVNKIRDSYQPPVLSRGKLAKIQKHLDSI
jgi:trimethylamine:corrinoid methyltransferase-like protein